MSENRILACNSLLEHWKLSGVTEGDVLLIHSGISRLLKKVYRDFNIFLTVEEIFNSLRDAVGISGTLVFPKVNFLF